MNENNSINICEKITLDQNLSPITFNSNNQEYGHENLSVNNQNISVVSENSTLPPIDSKSYIDSMIYERNNLSQSVWTLNQQLQDIMGYNKFLKLKNQNLNIQIADKDLEIKEKNINIEFLQNKINEINSLCQSQDITIKSQKNMMIQYHEENKVYDQKIIELTDKIEEYSFVVKNKNYQNESDVIESKTIEKQRVEITNLNLQLENLTDENSSLKKSNTMLKEKLNENKEFRNLYFNQIEKLSLLSQTCDKFQKENILLNVENQNLKDEIKNINKVEETKAKNNNEIEIKDSMIRELSRKLEKIELINHDKKALLEKLKADRYSVSKCLDQNAKLKEMLDKRDQEINDLNLKKQEITKYYEKMISKNSNQNITNFIDSNYIGHSLFEYANFLYKIHRELRKHFAFDEFENHNKLKQLFKELKDVIKDLHIKNNNLKKVNIQLNDISINDCHVIKQLNEEIFKLKQDLNSKDSEACSLVIRKESPVSSLHKSLKTESQAILERQFNRVKQEKYILQRKLEDMDHLNILLSEECNTIGDYVHMYISKRIAMKITLENISHFFEELVNDAIKFYTKYTSFLEIIGLSLLKNENGSEGLLEKTIEDTNKILSQLLNKFSSPNIVDAIKWYNNKIKKQISYPWNDFIEKYS